MRVKVGQTYAGEISVLPEQSAANEQEIFQVEHGCYGVGKEPQEMWKRYVRDAIGWMVFVTYHDLKIHTRWRKGPTCPDAVVIHLRDAPGTRSAQDCKQTAICVMRTVYRSCSDGHVAALASRISCNNAAVKTPLPRHVHKHPWFGCSRASHSGCVRDLCSMFACSKRAAPGPRH
jgi:hypothetical protein